MSGMPRTERKKLAVADFVIGLVCVIAAALTIRIYPLWLILLLTGAIMLAFGVRTALTLTNPEPTDVP